MVYYDIFLNYLELLLELNNGFPSLVNVLLKESPYLLLIGKKHVLNSVT